MAVPRRRQSCLGTPREQVPGTQDRNATTCCYGIHPPLVQVQDSGDSVVLRSREVESVFIASKTWVEGLSDFRPSCPLLIF